MRGEHLLDTEAGVLFVGDRGRQHVALGVTAESRHRRADRAVRVEVS